MTAVVVHEANVELGLDETTANGPVSIDFKNLTYSVPGKRKKQDPPIQILNCLSGNIKAGKLTACMGPSGAGKTSLLNILAHRVGKTSGEVYLDKRLCVDRNEVLKCSSYVQQDDCMLATQTVRETIEFAAQLRLPRSFTPEEKKERTEEVIKLFNLGKCASTYIGDPTSKLIGVSGGERKRTAIACSCVAYPQVLFLDEPTSGLDSFTAISVIKVLKKLSERGVTVVTTIHQPNYDTFKIFDDLLLILNGNIIYHSTALGSVEYFKNLNFECPTHDNPADYYFMHVMTEGDEEARQKINFDQTTRDKMLEEKWKEQNDFDGTNLSSDVPFVASTTIEGVGEQSSALMQFRLLYGRSFKEATRNPMRLRAQFGQNLFFAIVTATIWWGVGNDIKSIQDRNGVLFFISMNGMMSSMMGVLSTFGNERGTFVRDLENGLYGVGPYFLGKISCDGPSYILFPSMLVTVMYWTVGLQSDVGKYVTCVMIVILLNFAGSSIGLAIASIFEDIAVALLVAPLIMIPLVMFCGFFLNADSIPVYYVWTEWFSPMKYAFSALSQNEYNGLKIVCQPDEFIQVTSPQTGELMNKCPFTTGEEFLETMNIQEFLSIKTCLMLLALMAFCCYCLAFMMLKRLTTRKSTA